MTWRPDYPVTLPDGRLVCHTHGFVICGGCCVDYSFMEDTDTEDEDVDESDASDDTLSSEDMNEGPAGLVNTLRVGTGRLIPTKAIPPNDKATPHTKAISPVRRFIRQTDPATFLIYTDGSCLNNGEANAVAGCSFVFKPLVQAGGVNSCRFPLEREGPTGELHPQTSNRAELRAVIAALRFRYWPGEGFDRLVIATDSEYVVEGITSWIRGWLRRD
ncbi:uncharacterized protein N7498_009881 [Penicillium cinerascens]|uniref:ribonuclease H n=1 Tax=Penicillium cinerascens TaxID=70096 RepID=A0A9W9J7Y7_9EURO|nr:uncharacterized protein N7498_009881 [Penicillium cinerascens]KAJ5190896.1 hypothetical protein N7498_009881 [Penicillium cinerascens]